MSNLDEELDEFLDCVVMELTPEENQVMLKRKRDLSLAVDKKKYWTHIGDDYLPPFPPFRFGVEIMDLQANEVDPLDKILDHMNAWSQWANVWFERYDNEYPQACHIRICRCSDGNGHQGSRRGEGGYWALLGTDILGVRSDEPNMHLGNLRENSPEYIFYRKVRHETGHVLGFKHEHLRAEIVNRIDPQKAISYYAQQAHGSWDDATTRHNVLTANINSVLLPNNPVDPNSVMCYDLSAEIMKDNIAVIGGPDIDDQDARAASNIYPKEQGWSTPIKFRIAANQLAVGNHPDGQLELFYTGIDGKLYNKSQQSDDTWSEGTNFPRTAAKQICVTAGNYGTPELYLIIHNTSTNTDLAYLSKYSQASWSIPQPCDWLYTKKLAVGVNRDGRHEVFYLTTNNVLYHTRQTEPNGASWTVPTGWPEDSPITTNQFVVTWNNRGQLILLYTSSSNEVFQMYQKTTGSLEWIAPSRLADFIEHHEPIYAQQLAAGINRNSGRELFYVGTDNSLHHIYQSQPQASWSKDKMIYVSAKQIALGRKNDWRLELFYIGANSSLYHKWQIKPDSKIWSIPTLFDATEVHQLAVGISKDERLELIYTGNDNTLYHNSQTVSGLGWPDHWSGQAVITSSIHDPHFALQVALCMGNGNLFQLFYISATDNSVWRMMQLISDANSTSVPIKWSEPQQMNLKAAAITVAQNSDGTLQLIYTKLDGSLHTMRENQPIGHGSWGEEDLKSSAHQMAMIKRASGQLELFYVKSDNSVWQMAQTQANSQTWSNPINMNLTATSIAASINKIGLTELFFTKIDGSLFHIGRIKPGTAWTSPEAINVTAKQISAAAHSNGKFEVFYIGTNDQLYHKWQW